MANYTELEVYKRSYQLALDVHKFSLKLPKELQYDLADQMRRASRSIPSNLAEGYGRNKSKKDILNFVRTALGSNDEVLFNLQFLHDSGYLNNDEYCYFKEQYIVCGKQLQNLTKYLKTNQLDN